MEGLTGTELEAVVDERLICRRAYAAEYFVAAVSGIVEERVADRLHVYACVFCLTEALQFFEVLFVDS